MVRSTEVKRVAVVFKVNEEHPEIKEVLESENKTLAEALRDENLIALFAAEGASEIVDVQISDWEYDSGAC